MAVWFKFNALKPRDITQPSLEAAVRLDKFVQLKAGSHLMREGDEEKYCLLSYLSTQKPEERQATPLGGFCIDLPLAQAWKQLSSRSEFQSKHDYAPGTEPQPRVRGIQMFTQESGLGLIVPTDDFAVIAPDWANPAQTRVFFDQKTDINQHGGADLQLGEPTRAVIKKLEEAGHRFISLTDKPRLP